MKKITIFGAGLSARFLVEYLNNEAHTHNWSIDVVDVNQQNVEKRASGLTHVNPVCADGISDEQTRSKLIEQSDLVISMLPAFLHIHIAKSCVAHKKNLITASYISDEIKALEEDIKKNDLFFLFECGLDPGIDHMSAMDFIHRIQDQGGKIDLFESFTGGLVAPDSDDNPWNYKFTWNPRNVVMAGHGGTVKFLHEGKFKYIPYHQLFRRTEFIDIEGWGRFEGYANRDSLKYKEIYGLEGINTLYRGTLRRMRFGKAWNVFVQLGLTDDSYKMENVEGMTYRQFINSFLAYNPTDSVELKLMHYLKIEQDSTIMEKIQWLGIFDDTPIKRKEGSPAQILQEILENKWRMKADDNDMIVMFHRFGYELNGKYERVDSCMVETGKGSEATAMAKTVGLPVAIAAKELLTAKHQLKGLHIPIKKELYRPILDELKGEGIRFIEKKI